MGAATTVFSDEMVDKTRVPLQDAEPHAVVDDATLKKSLVHGVMWTGSIKWIAQLVSWPVMIVIARVLTPSDFGFVALVTVWTRLIMLLTEGGVGGAIVFGPVLQERQLRQLNAVASGLSVLAFLAASALAFPVARFYRSPDLAWVMIGIAVTFLLEGAMLIPTARMRREMRFKELALADAGRAIVDSLVTLTLALLGARYWALVGGYGAGVLAVAVTTMCLRPTRLQLPRWRDVGATLRYATDLLLTSLTSFLYSSADLLIAGRLLSSSAVGAYSFAGTLAYAPGEKLVSALTRVTPSVFGSLGSDRQGIRRYVERITRLLGIVILPVLGGIAATAPSLVPVLLGPQWSAVAIPLQLLCIHAAIIAVTGIVPQVLQSTGNARVVTQNGFMALVLYTSAFLLLGSRWGIAGIAAAWACVTPLLVSRLVARMCREISLPLTQYLRLLAPAVAGTAWMILCVRAVTGWLSDGTMPGVVVLVLEVAGGVIAYVGAIFVLDRHTIVDLIRQVRRLPIQFVVR